MAQPSANLDNLPADQDSSVADGEEQLGTMEGDQVDPDRIRDFLATLHKEGQMLVNLASNRIPVMVKTPQGSKTFRLPFKAAQAYGRKTARRWLMTALGPTTDNFGRPIGLSQAGRTRVRSDLVRGLISRREATFLGIQSALVIATEFSVLRLPEWDGFRHQLFKDCYECSNISLFGKQWKKFTTAIQNSLLNNLLMTAPRAQLEQIVVNFPTARRVVELLLRAGIRILTYPNGTRARLWLVAHLTQSRFLPGPSRKECLDAVIELKERLCGARLDGSQWEATEAQLNSISLACYQVGNENRESRFAKDVTQSHLSLSNSACLEFTRTEGGKLAILWGDFREFLDTKISTFFTVRTKQSDELDALTALQERVLSSVRNFSNDLDEHGESPRGTYTRGVEYLERLRILNDITETPMFGWPSYVNQDVLHTLNNPKWPEVFNEHTRLYGFLPVGFQLREAADAYQIAMINLTKAIERMRLESTGVFDAIGNEICSEHYVDLPIWKVAYLDEPMEESKFAMPSPMVDSSGEKILDLQAGIDSRLGMLLFLWSEIEYRKWVQGGSLPLPVDPVPISEPGVKARIATKSLIWINLFLSPASHLIKDVMLTIPGCRVGLKGSDHAWNFEASFGRHASSWKEIEAISTSDLTAATDWLEHDMAKAGMKAFLDGRFEEHSAKTYLHNAIDLVCSPRLLVSKPACFNKRGGQVRNPKVFRKYKAGPEPLQVETGGKLYSGYVTTRGVLMGEPLTKMILSLFSIAAERSARASDKSLNPHFNDYLRTRTKLHQYACAGDDHIGLGKVSYLSQIPKILQYWSGEISWDKYCISHYGAHYCQDFLIKPEPGPRYALRPTSKLASSGMLADRPKFKIDHIWLRLLSDRRKVGSAVFEETNPFPGKSKALTEMLSWTGRSLSFKVRLLLMQKLGLGRWFPASYLKDPRSYVPQAFGGRGLVVLPNIELILSESLKYCIVHSENIAVRIANGSGDSRKLRGVILDESDKALARLQNLDIRVYTRAEAEEETSAEDMASFGEVSRTALQSKLSEQFIDYDRLDLTEKKIAVISKAFRGPSVLKEEQKSYEGRMRSVARAQQRIFSDRGEITPAPEVSVAIMQPWVARTRLYVLRTDLTELLPRGIIPSFTIPVSFLSGSMNRIELEGRVVKPQLVARTDVSARIESDAMSVVSDTTNGTSLP